MAAYGALISLMNTINIIQHHPHPPISLDKHQIESLTEAANFFKDFLRIYNPHASYTEKADPLENRIAAASYAAEDAIEFSIVDHVLPDSDVAVGSSNLFEDLQRVMGDMDSIKKEVMEIKQGKGVQRLQILSLQSHSTTKSSASKSSSTQQNATTVGIEEVANELMEKLVGGNPSRQVIPITGMGGVGKTTLATNVYKHQTVVERFDIRMWASISQDFRMKETLLRLNHEDSSEMNEYELGEKLHKKLSGRDWATISQDFGKKETLLRLNNKDSSEMNESQLGEELHKKLLGRRYLIVLDDIWDVKVWDALQLYFPDYNNNSRIVLTTRLSKMAHDVSGYGSPSLGIEMKFLNEDTSWDLFCKVVFGKEEFPIELETIGRKIVASCKGLPLSINVIGGLLKVSARTPQYWEYVVENLNSIVNSEDNEHCLNILYTSYNSLSVHLKPCLMCMGIFKEDSEISVSHLTQLWVAEGFVETESGKSLEEVAEEQLTELVDRNLVLVQQVDCLGKLKLCKIHDLLRDLCLREARKHEFLYTIGEHSFDIPRELSGERRICSYEMMKWKNLWGAFESSSVVRSLMWEDEQFSVPSFGLKLLRVCSVRFYSQYILNFLDRIVNLRFLCVWGPAYVDSLVFSNSIPWNLQALIVDPISFGTLPSEIWNRPQLRLIEIKYSVELPSPPPKNVVFVLENLHTLSRVKNMKFGDEVVKRIPNIKKLKVVYRNVDEGLHGYSLNNVSNLRALSSLSLDFESNRFSSEMQTLTFPQSLKKLSLKGTCCLQWEDMAKKLGSLPMLQVLRLRNDAYQGGEWHTAEGQFCSLKVLEIALCDLEYWETDNSHFPRLEHLLLTGLWNLKEVPSSIGDICTLQSIRLDCCSSSACDSAKRIREEQVEQGNEGLQVKVQVQEEGIAFGSGNKFFSISEWLFPSLCNKVSS